MDERAKSIRIYGNELLQEECVAVVGIMKMLKYQQDIDRSRLVYSV